MKDGVDALLHLKTCPCNKKPKMALGGSFTPTGVVPATGDNRQKDTFNAVLAPNEFIVRAAVAKEYKPDLMAMNSGSGLPSIKLIKIHLKLMHTLIKQTKRSGNLLENIAKNITNPKNPKKDNSWFDSKKNPIVLWFKDQQKKRQEWLDNLEKETGAKEKGRKFSLSDWIESKLQERKEWKEALRKEAESNKKEGGFSIVGWLKDQQKNRQEWKDALLKEADSGTVSEESGTKNLPVVQKRNFLQRMGDGLIASADKQKQQQPATLPLLPKPGTADATDAALEKEQAEDEAVSRETKLVKTVISIEKILKECCKDLREGKGGLPGKGKKDGGSLSDLAKLGAFFAGKKLAGWGLKLIGGMIALAGWPAILAAVASGAAAWWLSDGTDPIDGTARRIDKYTKEKLKDPDSFIRRASDGWQAFKGGFGFNTDGNYIDRNYQEDLRNWEEGGRKGPKPSPTKYMSKDQAKKYIEQQKELETGGYWLRKGPDGREYRSHIPPGGQEIKDGSAVWVPPKNNTKGSKVVPTAPTAPTGKISAPVNNKVVKQYTLTPDQKKVKAKNAEFGKKVAELSKTPEFRKMSGDVRRMAIEILKGGGTVKQAANLDTPAVLKLRAYPKPETKNTMPKPETKNTTSNKTKVISQSEDKAKHLSSIAPKVKVKDTQKKTNVPAENRVAIEKAKIEQKKLLALEEKKEKEKVEKIVETNKDIAKSIANLNIDQNQLLMALTGQNSAIASALEQLIEYNKHIARSSGITAGSTRKLATEGTNYTNQMNPRVA
jgi:hypothetical protein